MPAGLKLPPLHAIFHRNAVKIFKNDFLCFLVLQLIRINCNPNFKILFKCVLQIFCLFFSVQFFELCSGVVSTAFFSAGAPQPVTSNIAANTAATNLPASSCFSFLCCFAIIKSFYRTLLTQYENYILDWGLCQMFVEVF